MSWNYNAEDLNKELSAGNYLEKSGCYKAKIVSIEEKETSNGGKQVVFKLDVEGKETTIYHVYTKKDGSLLDFKVRHLNHLLYLNKLTEPSKLKTIEGKEIGVMLKAKLSLDKKYVNFDIEGFYHLQTGKTAKELKDNLPAKTVNEFKAKYEAEEPLKRENNPTENHSTTTETEENDDFPFA